MGRAFEVRKAAMAKTSAMKAKIYSRYGKEIYLAAKAGEPDINMNSTLKRVVEKAKTNQVPADVIKRAIDKAKGNNNIAYISAMYEGFLGAGTILVECLSDNANRAVACVRAAFNKAHAKLGTSGSVSFNYRHQGELVFNHPDSEAVMAVLFATDVEVYELEDEDGEIYVSVAVKDLYKAKEALEEEFTGLTFQAIEIVMKPLETVTLEGDDLMLFQRLVQLLNDEDDVQNVYHNVENLDHD